MADATRETRLVLRAQAGDREAFDALLTAVQGPLCRYVVSLTGDAHLAEDVLQETFLLVWRKLAWLDEPGLFRAWAYRIASREAFRRLRRERKWAAQVREEGTLAALPAPPPRAEFAPELIAALPQLVGELSPHSRAVIALHYLEEMTLEEVAAVLGVPVGTVKSRLAYGLNQLRRRVRT
jgi:RNA polymerase sigma-70 factor, ECF subfamily